MPRTRSRKVLVVDDSLDSREMLVEYLAFCGFTVAQATHGDEAVTVAKRVRPSIVLMDLSMPGVDGWEATRRLKSDAETRDCIIVAVSAHAFPPERKKAQDAGCDAFIVKPYDLTRLAKALDRVLVNGVSALNAIALAPTMTDKSDTR